MSKEVKFAAITSESDLGVFRVFGQTGPQQIKGPYDPRIRAS